jgi:hypothetical protein
VAVPVPALAGAPAHEEGCPGDCVICDRLRRALLSELDRRPFDTIAAAGLAAAAELPEPDLAGHYGSVDDCLVAAYDELSREVYGLQADALNAGSGDWRARFLDGVRAALDHLASVPGGIALFFGDDLRAHPLLRVRRAALRQRLARLVADQAREPAPRVEFLLGALAHAAHAETAARGMQPARVTARVNAALRLLEARAA